jgi:hypothetical protein
MEHKKHGCCYLVNLCVQLLHCQRLLVLLVGHGDVGGLGWVRRKTSSGGDNGLDLDTKLLWFLIEWANLEITQL